MKCILSDETFYVLYNTLKETSSQIFHIFSLTFDSTIDPVDFIPAKTLRNFRCINKQINNK